jgi:methylmalonyl-CoA/ethylmalonyl-CoA epimerase
MNLSSAKIVQLLIPVDGFESGVSYYLDVLGLPLLFAAPPHMAFFNVGGLRLLVGVGPPGQKAQRGSAIYFEVADIHAVYSSLKSSGGNFKGGPQPVNRTSQSEVWLAEVTDPDGNQLALLCNIAVAGA